MTPLLPPLFIKSIGKIIGAIVAGGIVTIMIRGRCLNNNSFGSQAIAMMSRMSSPSKIVTRCRMVQARLVQQFFCSSRRSDSVVSSSSPASGRGDTDMRISTAQSWDGTVVTRIVPKTMIDYEQRLKPANRRVLQPSDVDMWTRRISADNSARECQGSSQSISNVEAGEEEKEASTDHGMMVLVDVDFNLQLHHSNNAKEEESSQQQEESIVFHMDRDANETGRRTLQRLQCSAQRRIDSLQKSHHGQRNTAKHQLSSRGSSSCSAADGGSNTSCFVRIPNGKGLEEVEAVCQGEDDLDGYITFPISEHLRSSSLWLQLRKFSPNLPIVYMPVEQHQLSVDVSEETSPIIRLQLISCPPTIVQVQTFDDFEADVFVGVPLVVETQVIHATKALIVWFADSKQVLYDSNYYVPTPDDVGKQISVLINPIRRDDNSSSSDTTNLNTGYEEVYQYSKVVQERPYLPILEQRRDWLFRRHQQNQDQHFRIMSYNLLADLYTTREVDQQLMYNFCQPQHIARTRRMPLLVYEILQHRPDILCLQEVDSCVFDTLLLPVLKTYGYQGFYSNKVSVSQLEGCAIFWCLGVFEKDAIEEEFAFRDLVDTTHSDGNHADSDGPEWDSTMNQIKLLLDEHSHLGEVVRSRVGQILQVATLRRKHPKAGEPEALVVGNTHLFYHPMADHIRVIQSFLLCKQLDLIRRKWGASTTSSSPKKISKPLPIIFCGDLNSSPLSGTVRLLLNRRVEPYHFETWKNLYEYSWEKGEDDFLFEHGFIGNDVGDIPVYTEEEFCDAVDTEDPWMSKPGASTPPEITLPNSFPKLISGYIQMPEFTNYSIDFAETLDYIFASAPSSTSGCDDKNDASSGFEVVSSAPIPSKMAMKPFVGMPNENMPSDHVAIACDLKWK